MALAPPAPAELPPCLLARPGDVCWLTLAVVPNAKHTGADGLFDGALRVRLNAPPVDGKANDKLLSWLASELGCPRRALTLLRGDASRRKTVEVSRPAAEVARWLAQALRPAA
jgi:uncharacterized protein YggU (UPF0235/DUF167 family)